MWYTVPRLARKVTAPVSNLLATSVSLPSELPVYTARSASKSLPVVSNRKRASSGAVQEYQTELCPNVTAWTGSSGSRVAPWFVPVTFPSGPLRDAALAKSSLGGGGLQLRIMLPVAPWKPSTAIKYVSPFTAENCTRLGPPVNLASPTDCRLEMAGP